MLRNCSIITIVNNSALASLNISTGEPLRCAQCAAFTAFIRKATLAHDRCQIEKAQEEHLRNVRQFRCIQGRLTALSEASTSTQGDGSMNSGGILKIDLDGLDQAKTKYPRNLQSSKSLSNLWKPQIHMLTALVWGVAQWHIKLLYLYVCWWWGFTSCRFMTTSCDPAFLCFRYARCTSSWSLTSAKTRAQRSHACFEHWT